MSPSRKLKPVSSARKFPSAVALQDTGQQYQYYLPANILIRHSIIWHDGTIATSARSEQHFARRPCQPNPRSDAAPAMIDVPPLQCPPTARFAVCHAYRLWRRNGDGVAAAQSVPLQPSFGCQAGTGLAPRGCVFSSHENSAQLQPVKSQTLLAKAA